MEKVIIGLTSGITIFAVSFAASYLFHLIQPSISLDIKIRQFLDFGQTL